MKVTIKRICKSISRVNGNSLAEFATVSALMATLAATAAPKLSEVSEGTKAQKSMNEIDKLLTQAKNFYQEKADTEGRGRFPGQDKYDARVGSHTNKADIVNDLIVVDNNGIASAGSFTTWTGTDGKHWRSVFGTTNADAYNGGTEADWQRLVKENPGYQNSNSEDVEHTGGEGEGLWSDDQETTDDCTHCTGKKGTVEWLQLMGGDAMASPFQDGHYVYAVEPGGHKFDAKDYKPFSPTLYIADVENPSDFNAVLQP